MHKNPRISDVEALRLRMLREHRKRIQMRSVNGLLMTEKDYEEHRMRHCAGCGDDKIKPKLWFGELFCGECVEAFKHGKSK